METKLFQSPGFVVVGCGGIAAHLVPSLAASVPKSNNLANPFFSFIDGDKVERKNLERQLFFNALDVGKNKASVMQARVGARWGHEAWCEDKYLISVDEIEPDLLDRWGGCCVLCCADNHRARSHSLQLIDKLGTQGCIAANEATEAEAYWYRANWQGTKRDPRMFYPEIVTDTSYDPLTAVHCSASAEQTVLANMLAAAQMLWLVRLWTSEYVDQLSGKADDLSREVYDKLPWRFRSGLSLFETVR